MFSNLRFAFRQHLRQPGFAATVLCTLAISTGATTAVFAVVNTVIVRALPFASPDRLVWVASVRADNPSAPFTLPEFLDYRNRTRALSGLAAFAYWSASLAGESVTERLTGARMSGNTFDVLGMTAAAGRLLNDADDRPDAPPVVLLSYRLWQRRYDGSPDAIGKTARINGASFEIVGSTTGTMRQFLEESLGPRRFNLGLFGAFALTAVLLAIVGLYGLVSYAVSQRDQEIGLRMAIGATQQDVQRMILRQAAVLGILGAIVGLGLALGAQRLTSRMVEDVSIHPAMVVGLATVLIAVVLLAAWRPARRAARIDPTLALKAQ